MGLSALWIGSWGYFAPALQKSIPFPVPPLHARFLGAMYLSAVILLVGGLLSRSWKDLTIVPVMTALWTGGIFLVSVLHLEQFNFSKAQTWIWLVAYGIYPLIAIYLWRVHRSPTQIPDGSDRTPISPGIRRYLLGQGVVLCVLAAALALLPGAMVSRWPWPIDEFLAQLYSAPFISFGIGSLVLSRSLGWSQMRVGSATLAVFAAGVLIASLIHRSLFSLAQPADAAWFAGFTLATVVLGLTLRRSVRHG